jgi:hypothetical protein
MKEREINPQDHADLGALDEQLRTIHPVKGVQTPFDARTAKRKTTTDTSFAILTLNCFEFQLTPFDSIQR